jgi:Acyclic terpene utilisation family protein AtuA
VPSSRLLSATGMLGTGFPEPSLRLGLEMDPHVIACDAGSTDAGPADLATGRCRYPEPAYRRDLRLLLPAALSQGVPLIIGSAGGAGGDANVDWARRILLDVAAELGLTFRLAVIYAGQEKEWLRSRLAAGRIRPLPNGPAFDQAVIDDSTCVVGMMGVEPIIAALESGADVVLAGRATDTSLFAAVPLMRGAPAGPTWHAAKILECGAAAVEHRAAPDCMFAEIDESGFTVRAPNPELTCSPVSVAAHSLYENADPFEVIEPSGVMDTRAARYFALDAKSVRVEGSKFRTAERYTVKLEGVRLAAYQTIVVAGIRDPVLLRDLPSFMDACRTHVASRVGRIYPGMSPDSWNINFRLYGLDGTMGSLEPVRKPELLEVGFIIEVSAQSQEAANHIAAIARHQALHQSVPGWKGFVSNIALPYGATDLVRGPVYEFTMHAVVMPDDPYEMFRTEFVEVTRDRYAATEVA